MANIFTVLKGLFTKTTTGVASSSYIPYNNAAGELQGQASVTELASVLGGVGFYKGMSLSDCDDAEVGTYLLQIDSVANKPEEATGYWVLETTNQGTNIFQKIFQRTSNGFFARSKTSGGWSPWRRLSPYPYLSEYSTLSDLASALGAITTPIPANADLNDYKTQGRYYCNNATTAATLSNTPTTTSGFYLEVLVTSSANFQRVTSAVLSTIIYQRRYQISASSWGAWYKFEGTAVS